MALHLRDDGGVLIVRALFSAITAVSLLGWTPSPPPPRFYPDDPLAVAVESQDASNAAEYEIDLVYETLAYTLDRLGDRSVPSPRAGNVNTIDEVPDSGWFTNRILARPIAPAELAIGPAPAGDPPDPSRWVITRGKSSGVSAGFTARDARGETWFISFDSSGNPDAGTGAVIVANRIMHALGYWQLENQITEVDPARVSIDPSATIRGRHGIRRPFTEDDLARVFHRSARRGTTYRAVASRQAPGTPLGHFLYYGTRSDDPNDLVPHEHRRELRALRVVAGWINLIDLKSGNTLDVLVPRDGRQVIRHYIQDVGSTFGTRADSPRHFDEGWEYVLGTSLPLDRLLLFGFPLPPWATIDYDEVPGIGRFEGEAFDPLAWRARTPLPPFRHLRPDDAFWAARRIMAFSDEAIRAMAEAGRYSDPRAAPHLADVLIQRRNRIGEVFYRAVCPLVDFSLGDDGTLTFVNAAVAARFDAAPAGGYRATWSRFDNATSTADPIGESRSSDARLSPPGPLPAAAGSYVQVDVSVIDPQHPAWSKPVTVHFRREGGAWVLVGVDRSAAGDAFANRDRPAGTRGQ